MQRSSLQRHSFLPLALLVGLIGPLLLLAAPSAQAQMTLVLDQSAISVKRGGSFAITGGLIADPNNTAAVASYALDFTPVPPTTQPLGVLPVGAPPDPTQLTVDDTGYFTNFDGVSTSVPSGTGLFQFSVGSAAPIGEYTGSVTFNDANGNGLTTASFDLKITSVPELGTLPLLGGIFLAGGLLRRQLRKR